MLARARLRDDTLFSHAARKQALADGIDDLVSTRVIAVLSLERDGGAAA